ncbi:hypothetical protein HGM15179_000313, partial [Zosterops borbonicus]
VQLMLLEQLKPSLEEEWDRHAEMKTGLTYPRRTIVLYKVQIPFYSGVEKGKEDKRFVDRDGSSVIGEMDINLPRKGMQVSLEPCKNAQDPLSVNFYEAIHYFPSALSLKPSVFGLPTKDLTTVRRLQSGKIKKESWSFEDVEGRFPAALFLNSTLFTAQLLQSSDLLHGSHLPITYVPSSSNARLPSTIAISTAAHSRVQRNSTVKVILKLLPYKCVKLGEDKLILCFSSGFRTKREESYPDISKPYKSISQLKVMFQVTPKISYPLNPICPHYLLNICIMSNYTSGKHQHSLVTPKQYDLSVVSSETIP